MKMREIIRERDEASATALELAQMLVKFCEAVELDDEETTIARCVEARRLLKKIQGEA